MSRVSKQLVLNALVRIHSLIRIWFIALNTRSNSQAANEQKSNSQVQSTWNWQETLRSSNRNEEWNEIVNTKAAPMVHGHKQTRLCQATPWFWSVKRSCSLEFERDRAHACGATNKCVNTLLLIDIFSFRNRWKKTLIKWQCCNRINLLERKKIVATRPKSSPRVSTISR